MLFREAIDRDAEDLLELSARIADLTGHAPLDRGLRDALEALGNDRRAQERRLDAAALDLRRRWLAEAHRPGDATFKSPQAGVAPRSPCGERIAFGYERDLDVSLLEGRGAAYAPAPAGWSSELVIFRSGQAALSGALQFAAETWGQDRALSVAHAGAYFETTALLAAWPRRVFRPAGRRARAADLLIAEPVWCDGGFGCGDALPRARRLVIVDTTLSGPLADLSAMLAAPGEDCEVVLALSSGLKLDQAGLELANVGLLRVLVRAGAARQASAVAQRLRGLRALMATGLTLDELSALTAPWFLDRAYAARYATAIFGHNASLAQAIGRQGAVFGPRSHPGLDVPGTAAPFCALQLREPTVGRYRRLADIVAREADRRGLVLARGGSFGFRGHRFETIEPDPAEGAPFLRVALGWRGGHSTEGLVALFGELAACPSFAALEARYGT